jgi:hypothetical protein
MDRVFTPAGQPEFAGAGLEVVSDTFLHEKHLTPTAYKTRYSDHYMVLIEMKVTDDDD